MPVCIYRYAHFPGEVDPIRDLEIISSELRLKDLSYLQNALDKVEKLAVRAGDKTKKVEHDTLMKVKEMLATKFVRQHDWNEKEVGILKFYFSHSNYSYFY
jgi:obg-like ATPase 1